MKKYQVLFTIIFVSAATLLVSCEKEFSFESGMGGFLPGGNAQGTLEGSPNACASMVVNGLYAAGLATDTSNRVIVQVNFTASGQYSITTDTVNGFFFAAAGAVGTTGSSSLTLQANGTPTSVGVFTFTVRFGTSQCTFTVNVLPLAPAPGADYFPMTAGSNWRYTSNDPAAGPADTVRKLSTGITGTLAGNTWNLFLFGDPPDPDSLIYRKAGGNYHHFNDIDIALIASDFVLADYIFLKDNVPAGTNWQSQELDATVGGNTVKMRLAFNLAAKDVREQLDGQVYANVIKVQVTQQQRIGTGAWTNVLAYQSWYARGIGLINVVAPPPIFGYRVTRYQVN